MSDRTMMTIGLVLSWPTFAVFLAVSATSPGIQLGECIAALALLISVMLVLVPIWRILTSVPSRREEKDD